MRKKIAIIILIVVGLATYFILTQRDRFSSVEEEEITFSFDHPEQITKIYLVQKSSQVPVTLEKKGGVWYVNGKYRAWEKKMNYFLEKVLPKIIVKGPAPKAARDNVVRRMAVTGIKVELYTDDPEKAALEYYVGQGTPDMLGTYFWKEGAKTPYVVYIPGQDGYLTPNYSDPNFDNQEEAWISRTIFSEERENIKRITVNYPGKPMAGFEITQHDSILEISTDPRNPSDVNITALRSFMNHFERLNFEGLASIYPDSVLKSSLSSTPFTEIELENKKGKTITFKAYYLPSYSGMHGLYDNEGNMLQYDPNRFLAVISNFDRPVVIQDYTFRKVFVPYDDFLLSNAKRVAEQQTD